MTALFEAKFNPAELRDKRGKWSHGSLSKAIGALQVRTRMGVNGHDIDRTGSKGFRVRLKSGEVQHYNLPDDAARAALEEKHHDAPGFKEPLRPRLIKVNEPKPKPPAKPKTPQEKAQKRIAALDRDARELDPEPGAGGSPSELEKHFKAEYAVHSTLTPTQASGGFVVSQRENANTINNLMGYSKVPPIVRRSLAEQQADIYFGTGGVTQFDHLSDLNGKQPKGYRQGDQFDKVAGMVSYRPPRASGGHHHAVMAVGGGGHTYGSGSINMSAHEAAHAFDFGSVRLSDRNAKLNRAYAMAVEDFKSLMNPYFLQSDDRGKHEFFAETFAAWTEVHDNPNMDYKARFIAGSVGATPTSALPLPDRALNKQRQEKWKKAEALGTLLVELFDGIEAGTVS